MNTKWIEYKLELKKLRQYNVLLKELPTFEYFVVQILLLIANMVFDIYYKDIK